MQAHMGRVPGIGLWQSLSSDDGQGRRTHNAGYTREAVHEAASDDGQGRRTHTAGYTREAVHEAASMSDTGVYSPAPDCWRVYVGCDLQTAKAEEIGNDYLDKVENTAVKVQDGMQSLGGNCLEVGCSDWCTGEV